MVALRDTVDAADAMVEYETRHNSASAAAVTETKAEPVTVVGALMAAWDRGIKRLATAAAAADELSAGASRATKAKTGSGLKAGPGGLLGLAEGLAFTAIVVGLVVLAFQFADYGYLPNAIPVEGGRCD